MRALLCWPTAIANLRQAAVVELLVNLYLIEAQEFWSAFSAQAIELMHRGEEFFSSLLAKLATEPCAIVITKRFAADAVDVPGHIEEKFKIVACHFRIVYIHYPQSAHVVVVSLAHLVVNQSGLCGGKPEIIVRTAPVRKVIVNSASATSFLLAGI